MYECMSVWTSAHLSSVELYRGVCGQLDVDHLEGQGPELVGERPQGRHGGILTASMVQEEELGLWTRERRCTSV